MNLPYFIPSEIIILSLIFFLLVFIYENIGIKSILLLIPIYLFIYNINYDKLIKKNKILIQKDDEIFLYTLDNFVFDNYKKIENRFFNIYDEYKEFNNNKYYYKSLLIDNIKEMESIFKSFSLSTQLTKEDIRLNKIYNYWYNNIQSIISNI